MNYELLIQKAKKEINDGFNELGRKIENPSFLEIYLIVSTLKSIELTDAIMFLCKNNFNNESLIILRSLVEHSLNMHWIMKKDTEKRLEEYRSDLEKIELGGFWTKDNLKKRMKDIGIGEEYYDFVVKFTYSYAHVNAKSLKWQKVIKIDGLKSEPFPAQAIYSIVAQMLGHVLKSLNIHFKGLFDSYSDIWKEIEVDKSSIRKKIEKIAKNLDKQDLY